LGREEFGIIFVIMENRIFEIGGKKIEVKGEDLELIFKGPRPEGLDREIYKAVRSILKKELKEQLKGQLTHFSKYSNEVWDKVSPGVQKGYTYVKKRDNQ
jgi:hypothetical protein